MLVVRKSFCRLGVPSPACNFACSMMSLQRSPLLFSGPEIADSRTGVEAADNETGVATNKIGLAGHKDNETGVAANKIGLAGNKDKETGVAANKIRLAGHKDKIGLASNKDKETGVAANKIGLAGHKDKIGLAGNKDNETGVASNEIGLATNKYTIKLQLTLKRPTVLQCLRRARLWRYSQNATIFRELALTMPCATFRMSLCQCRPSRACCKAVKTSGSIVEQTS